MIGQRQTLVGALFALEIAILGGIIYFLGGARVGAAGFSADGVDIGGNREIATFNVGAAPHVTVRDPDSHVVVTVSHDGRVHVIDETLIHGILIGGAPALMQLHALQVGSDGVVVERAPQPTHFGVIGESRRRVEVQVPAAALVDVQKSSAADVTGMQADVKVRSQDGHVEVTDTTGNIDVASDDGRIELHNVHANHVLAVTADGHITATDLRVDGAGASATLRTNDGPVRVNGNLIATGTYVFATDDGRIEASLVGTDGIALDATTSSGPLTINGRRVRSNDDGATYHASGTAGGSLSLTTRDGRITLNTSGAI